MIQWCRSPMLSLSTPLTWNCMYSALTQKKIEGSFVSGFCRAHRLAGGKPVVPSDYLTPDPFPVWLHPSQTANVLAPSRHHSALSQDDHPLGWCPTPSLFHSSGGQAPLIPFELWLSFEGGAGAPLGWRKGVYGGIIRIYPYGSFSAGRPTLLEWAGLKGRERLSCTGWSQVLGSRRLWWIVEDPQFQGAGRGGLFG